MATFKEVAELRGHSSYVHGLDWSPDGKNLATGSGDKTIRIWRTDTNPSSARPPSDHRASPEPSNLPLRSTTGQALSGRHLGDSPIFFCKVPEFGPIGFVANHHFPAIKVNPMLASHRSSRRTVEKLALEELPIALPRPPGRWTGLRADGVVEPTSAEMNRPGHTQFNRWQDRRGGADWLRHRRRFCHCPVQGRW